MMKLWPKSNLAHLTAVVIFWFSFAIIDSVIIDNHVVVIKNDCFERQAIGYRLNPSDIYKTLDVKTVPECQRECTKEEDTCKTFSFGIGVRGNSSCELSKKVIRETADLKPIGAQLDEDFDLYIKKLGCKLVIKQKPATETQPQSDEIPTGTLGAQPYGPNNFKPKPQFGSFDSHKLNLNIGGVGSQAKPPKKPNETLQTSLISVRPDPNRPEFTGLSSASTASASGGYDISGLQRPIRPANEPLNERPYYGEGSTPRPSPDLYGGTPISHANSNDFSGGPGYGGIGSERPGGLYEGQSAYESYGSTGGSHGNFNGETYGGSYGGSALSYDRPSMSYKPYQPPKDPLDNEIFYNRPEVYRPEFRPGFGYYRPIDAVMDVFNHNFDNLYPEFWSGDERPDPMRDTVFTSSVGYYGSVGRPQQFDDSNFRPSHEARPAFNRPERPERPQRPIQKPSGYYRPSYNDESSPNRPSMGYFTGDMAFSRPGRPQYEYGNGYRPTVPPDFRPEVRPIRPAYEDRPVALNRPDKPDSVHPQGGYDQKPSEFRPPAEYNDEGQDPTIERPSYEDLSRPPFGDEPNFDIPGRPDNRPSRPSSNSYNEPNQFKPNWDKDTINRPYDPNNPNVNYEDVIKPVTEELGYGNRRQDHFGLTRNNTKFGFHHGSLGSIVSQRLGPNGEKITSIITEIPKAG